jgi:hypothetical protein
MDMVPAVEFPPETPFTLQVTAVFEVPVTVAVNCWVVPSNTLGLEDETVTVTDCGAGGGGGGDDEPFPPQPTRSVRKATKKAQRHFNIAVLL